MSQQARLDIVMNIGAVEQTIEVQAAAPLLQTENASVGQVIASEAVNSLPLNGRNFVQLAIIAPGVTGLDYAQPNTINSGRRPDELRPGGTTLQANGARNTSNQVLLDGIDNSESGRCLRLFSFPAGGSDAGRQSRLAARVVRRARQPSEPHLP